MSTPVQITDGRKGTVNKAGVTSIGQLTVAPFDYDETKFQELGTANTAVNFYTAKAGEQFVITGVVAFADKDVGDNTDTNIIIYEAVDSATATIAKILIQFGMGKLTSISITPLNILVNEGLFVNAKCDDADIHMTVMGYFIPKIS